MSSPGSNSYVGLSGGLVQASILHNLTILGSLSVWTTLCLSAVSGWGTLSGTGLTAPGGRVSEAFGYRRWGS